MTLALILLPVDAEDGRPSGSTLCATESENCEFELDSCCTGGNDVRVDRVWRSG